MDKKFKKMQSEMGIIYKQAKDSKKPNRKFKLTLDLVMAFWLTT